MGNETKERLPLRMKPETSRRLEQWYAADNCRSKNEFVEKAVNFYVDYLETRDTQSLLSAALLAVLDGRLGRLEDLIARREYTREVELDMGDYEGLRTLLHSGLHIQYMKSSDRQQYLKRRSNRKVRKYFGLSKKGNQYRKVFEYWWTLY